MLISIVAVFILSVAAGWNSLLAQVWPIVPEEPTSLRLALAGIVTLAAYSAVGRYRRRRLLRFAEKRGLDEVDRADGAPPQSRKVA